MTPDCLKLSKDILRKAFKHQKSQINFSDYLMAAGTASLEGFNLDIFGSKFRDLLLSAVKLRFVGLFEWLMLEAPHSLKLNRDLMISVICTSIDFKNFNVMAAILKYIDQLKVDIYGDNKTPLHLIMQMSNFDSYTLKKLIKLGLPLESQDSEGNTILHRLFKQYSPSFTTFYQSLELILNSG